MAIAQEVAHSGWRPIEATRAASEQGKMLEWAHRAHATQDGRAALRCGLGDAATICDLLVRRILEENRGRGGKGITTKLGRELAAVAKRCGDEIWAHRNRVSVQTTPLPDHPSADG